MGSEKVGAGEVQAAAVVRGGNNAFAVEAPWFGMAFECHGPEGVKWRDVMSHNVVVDQGKGYLINRAFGSITATTAGCVLALHSATTASNNVWSNISASQVVSYGASCPAITFASTHTASPATALATYGFTASTQTCSGAAVLLYTSASMGTNAATADIKMYAYGTFGASRLLQSADTLSVTVSLNFA